MATIRIESEVDICPIDLGFQVGEVCMSTVDREDFLEGFLAATGWMTIRKRKQIKKSLLELTKEIQEAIDSDEG